MTPGARVAAAIDILDQIEAGCAAEKALTAWARRSRFAGSKDRAAIRDLVFDALRSYQSYRSYACAHVSFGRALMIGAHLAADLSLAGIFTGQGYAPPPVQEDELRQPKQGLWDLPEWLVSKFQEALGEQAYAQAQVLRTRAPVTLRVNLLNADKADVMDRLQRAGFDVHDNLAAQTAITVHGQARGLAQTEAFQAGLFELQDAGSQALIEWLELRPEESCLDYCAGGGGKALAMAAQTKARVMAHDAHIERMKDIAPRAQRAGARVELLAKEAWPKAGFDTVLIDVPCSGSGTWRRAPDAKRRFCEGDLAGLLALQAQILEEALHYVGAEGRLVYATCSVLRDENEAQVEQFLAAHPTWRLAGCMRLGVGPLHDGFFAAQLVRVADILPI
jgi:16S rRNA (cytosine967-C5)-methyltransferase